MDRLVCIHGHFYQPPRENPWLEAVEMQDSAYPYHDWNERITAECYAPNAFARMLDSSGRITDLVNNYERISFDFGPTLLSWLETKAPEVYQAVVDADRESHRRFSGHGSAMAMAYNHMILPLANHRDRVTQVRWGIADFEHRFGRKPEGMWLPETAVDLETLEILAEEGITFTILSPFQAKRVRRIGSRQWRDVRGGRIDPSRVYVQRLPSGGRIHLFFYDGDISRAVAFENLLIQGENLANRLSAAFTGRDNAPLVHIATDGESYGHHHPHGDMALAYALHYIEANGLARVTNYAEYLENHPPTEEVEIIENTAWSCAHGIERWRSHCGCNSGHRDWNQHWRGPLRQALDWLRDAVAPAYEKAASRLLQSPWAARDDYIRVVLDRSPENVDAFFQRHARHELSPEEQTAALELLELQRHAMLMYTSCGWFFDELSGIETVQILQYAGRVVQLAEKRFGNGVEKEFLQLLEQAKSNCKEYGHGRRIYEKLVRPARVDHERIAAHYAISSLFESYPEQAPIFCYTAEREDYQSVEAGKARLIVGRARIANTITRESADMCFGVLHLGDHNINCGVRTFVGREAYEQVGVALTRAFERADFGEVIRQLDRAFGHSTYSLKSLFRDEQRRATNLVLRLALQHAEGVYRHLYEDYLPLMRFVKDIDVPLPQPFRTAIEFVLSTDLRDAFSQDQPDLDQIRSLLEQAEFWHVDLDSPALAYQLKKTIARIAEQFRDNADDLHLLQALTALVQLAVSLPFEVDLWQTQNVYFRLMQSECPKRLEEAERGSAAALAWTDQFVALGEVLAMQVADIKQRVDTLKQTPSVTDVLDDVLSRRYLPAATYRLQFHHQFTFADAERIVPYLNELGITDCYASPILQARHHSMHGYDICDHSRINPELGGEAGFDSLAEALRQHQIGLILDTVPNHMAIGRYNRWWMDVLENGPCSVYATYFDIDWHPVNPDLDNKVLIPILEDQYGKILESGKIQLCYENGAFYLAYYDHRLPVSPRSYAQILEARLDRVTEELGEDHNHVRRLRSIITAIGYLPPRTETAPERIAERNREKEMIKERIASLTSESPPVLAAIQEAVAMFNGVPGDPHSFDRLDELIDRQPYRPAFWRVAMEEINYRRFFDINELAAIRVELPQVFQAVHQVPFRLLAEGKITGLRIDHPDGLWDPTNYFRQVQEEAVVHQVRARLGAERCPPDLAEQVRARLAQRTPNHDGEPSGWPVYVVAEKILVRGETLPSAWAVAGTTGYDFLNAVNGLFIRSESAQEMDDIYSQFLGRRLDFGQLVNSSQKMIMLVSMSSELNSLSHQLDRLSEGNRRYRDFTLNSLTFALREVIAALPVYRTYITGPDAVDVRDQEYIEAAVEEAKDLNPRTAETIFDFIRDTILLRNLDDFPEAERPRLVEWTMKFQQLTGPVLAKGLEDTAFYIYNRLVSLNEVGGQPDRFGVSVEEFHQANRERLEHWPHSMLATSTHDTKRSEDVRARLDVLSEMPGEWRDAVSRWRSANADKKNVVENKLAPSDNDEYLLYQTLVGAWPLQPLTPESFADFRRRIADYMQKATREAKVQTSWINPHAEYDRAVQEFVHGVLPDNLDDPFIQDLMQFQSRVAFFGLFNSLSQMVLKMTSPGVPDFYQGSELWDFSLVDPDNRRPVDYELRQRLLSELRQRLTQSPNDRLGLCHELVANMNDGRIKLFTIAETLRFRRDHRDLFASGSYEPVQVVGSRAEHVCAFARHLGEQRIIVAVPRLVFGLLDGKEQPPLGPAVWSDTRLRLPAEKASEYRHLFTGVPVQVDAEDGGFSIAATTVFYHFPVAILVGGA